MPSSSTNPSPGSPSDLKELGDNDSLDVRRARAVGILADPQYALDLMSGREGAAPTPGHGGVANLFVHLRPRRPRKPTSPVAPEPRRSRSSERPPPSCSPTGSPDSPARAARSILRPVLDLGADRAVDQHDPPPAMREQVLLRDAHCVFPGCGRDSRSCDLDHVTPYVPMDEGGPPGQTHPGNLAPLCRTHHRVKTHTAGTTNASTTAAMSGPRPPGTSTTPTSPTDAHQRHPDPTPG